MYEEIEKSRLLENFNGIILVNKKPSISSYDVIRRFKKVFF
jgi:tRNA U55 pseudouridine synthase TruB